MNSSQLTINTYTWVTQREWVLADIVSEINKVLDGTTTGCIFLQVHGHMSGDEMVTAFPALLEAETPEK